VEIINWPSVFFFMIFIFIFNFSFNKMQKELRKLNVEVDAFKCKTWKMDLWGHAKMYKSITLEKYGKIGYWYYVHLLSLILAFVFFFYF